MKTYKSQNSRKFKRLRADYLMRYQMAGVEGEPFFSNLKDISGGGLKFWTDQAMSEGALLKMGVWVPPIEKTIEALARVTRVRRSRNPLVSYIAVRFIEISDEAQKALNEFIEYLATQPGARSLISEYYVVTRREMASL